MAGEKKKEKTEGKKKGGEESGRGEKGRLRDTEWTADKHARLPASLPLLVLWTSMPKVFRPVDNLSPALRKKEGKKTQKNKTVFLFSTFKSTSPGHGQRGFFPPIKMFAVQPGVPRIPCGSLLSSPLLSRLSSLVSPLSSLVSVPCLQASSLLAGFC